MMESVPSQALQVRSRQPINRVDPSNHPSVMSEAEEAEAQERALLTESEDEES